MALWSSAPWRKQAVGWMDERLADAGIRRTGDVEQPRLRPWGTALTAPTSGGRVWFKAPGPKTSFEVGLYALLHDVAPDHVLAPIAADAQRGWILLPDGGPVLGDQVSGPALVDALRLILPEYARLQRGLTPHVDRMLSLGVTDMRAEIMPTRFDEAMLVINDYAQQHGGETELATCGRLAGLRDEFASWCTELATAPGPPSLDHNDLHPGNVFAWGASDASRAKFYDWGDSVVAHPFAVMLVVRRVLRHALEVGHDSPAVRAVIDPYLEVFSDLAPHAALARTLRLACRVAVPARALVWNRALSMLQPGEHNDEASAPFETMEMLLDTQWR
ncbi:MAG: hypothetical protein WCB04_10695 [Mycobacteriales bacterium]